MITDVPFRDRIKSLRRVKASSLIPNPANWRRHPPSQLNALRAVLSEIGFVGAELAIETPEGLMLIDGHARQELSGDQKIPVLVTDLTPEEADTILATFDPLGAMAETDASALAELLERVTIESVDLMSILQHTSESTVSSETKLETLKVEVPPSMVWVLIGVPTVIFGDITEQIESIADMSDSIVEVTVGG